MASTGYSLQTGNINIGVANSFRSIHNQSVERGWRVRASDSHDHGCSSSRLGTERMLDNKNTQPYKTLSKMPTFPNPEVERRFKIPRSIHVQCNLRRMMAWNIAPFAPAKHWESFKIHV
ncbi:hypothetical protein E6O75_ATG03641 [Venturia nashicola]|uniref:Uncharacterized protein n=1 Tax=Venturia nashicola TaxID=86259 RepID=A0A4Z1PBN4_9PEZI|nr:hypothetical protein E6O75_ATG03641 [Venturia nashicola]